MDVTSVAPDEAALKAIVAEELEAVRRRSVELLAPLDEHTLVRQHSPLMSPLVWDLAHVGNFEELWLLRAVNGDQPLDGDLAAAVEEYADRFVSRGRCPADELRAAA